jgi:APA family basic amino acid/polyamine antiporter
VATSPGNHDGRLARRLGLFDAVVIGLGSMLGAGVFAAVAPAARAAGSGLLVGLAIAAFVAYCNGTSSARLAARYPASGGTYVYGRERLGAWWGYVAGWGFVVGKTASCSAMALTFGAYAAPSVARPLGAGAVVALTAINYGGVRKTASVTRVLVAVVLAALVATTAAAAFGGQASIERLGPIGAGGAGGVLEAAGLLFFAFAGYARIATLGEEIVDPARTIPRAIPIALGGALVVYAVVSAAALLVLGPDRLGASAAPLADVARAGSLDGLAPAVRIGGAVASLGVLLSLIAGVSRTMFAMASAGDLPRSLSAVHPKYRVPHHAEVITGAVIVVLVTVVDLRGAIGFSSFAVLVYYAIANASAWTLPRSEGRPPRALAGAGVAGCLLLAFTLPTASVAVGAAVLVTGVVLRVVRSNLRQ